jgi:hypothetical protein
MKIVIINGLHRSGTMLFSRLVNAFPDTFIIKDGFRIPWVYLQTEGIDNVRYPYYFYQNQRISINLNKKIANKEIFTTLLLKEIEAMSFTPNITARLRQKIAELTGNTTYKETFLSIFTELCHIKNVHYVGTKNTHMGPYAPLLLETFPDLLWIEIIRDPRGWYCSTKVSHPLNIFRSINLWNKAVEIAIRNNKKYKGRYIIITYDGLVKLKEASLQKVCDFLGISFTVTRRWIKNLDLIENDGSPWYPNSSYKKNGERVFGNQNINVSKEYFVLDEHPVSRWRKVLSWQEKAILNIATRKNRKILCLNY